MIPTSVHAELRYGGLRIGKVTQIQFQTSREALENTTLEKWDRTFLSGLRDSSGSGTLFYDPEDAATVALIEDVYENSTALGGVQLVFDSVVGKSVSASAVLTNVSVSVSFGEASVCEIQFQISGKPTANL